MSYKKPSRDFQVCHNKIIIIASVFSIIEYEVWLMRRCRAVSVKIMRTACSRSHLGSIYGPRVSPTHDFRQPPLLLYQERLGLMFAAARFATFFYCADVLEICIINVKTAWNSICKKLFTSLHTRWIKFSSRRKWKLRVFLILLRCRLRLMRWRK